MGVRTLTVTDAAYERLAALKRPGESFTDVILRITGRGSLSRLGELLSPAESAAVAEALIAARDERRERSERSGGGRERGPTRDVDDDGSRRDVGRRRA